MLTLANNLKACPFQCPYCTLVGYARKLWHLLGRYFDKTCCVILCYFFDGLKIYLYCIFDIF